MEQKEKLLIAWTLAVLAGCVNVPEELGDELQSTVGHNIKTVIARLGYPDSERVIVGDTVYTWSMHRHATLTLPQATTTTGYVGDQPITATTWGSESVPIDNQCTLQVATDPNGTIKSANFRGNSGGCRSFLSALQRWDVPGQR